MESRWRIAQHDFAQELRAAHLRVEPRVFEQALQLVVGRQLRRQLRPRHRAVLVGVHSGEDRRELLFRRLRRRRRRRRRLVFQDDRVHALAEVGIRRVHDRPRGRRRRERAARAPAIEAVRRLAVGVGLLLHEVRRVPEAQPLAGGARLGDALEALGGAVAHRCAIAARPCARRPHSSFACGARVINRQLSKTLTRISTFCAWRREMQTSSCCGGSRSATCWSR